MMIGLLGCSKDDSKNIKETFKYDKSSEAGEAYKYFEDCPIKANEVFLFHTYKDNLGIYNTDTKTWKALYNSEQNNLFSYSVKGQEQKDVFYTIGSTSYNDFSVVKYNPQNRMAETLMNVKASDSVIPIGYYKKKMYFIHNKNDLGDNETRTIAYMKDKNLVDFIDVQNAQLSNAVIVGEQLYYTIYSEKKGMFDLYCYSFTNSNTEKISEIFTDQIFRHKNELLYVDKKNNLVSLKKEKIFKIKENADVDILSDYGLLVQIYVNKDSDIACDVIKLKDKSVIETVSKFDGYIINEKTLELYCEGAIKKLEI